MDTPPREDPTVAALRWPLAAILAALAIVPFLFTAVPPLTDVPGHMGRFAVQTAHAGDAVLRDFDFHWTLTLNLASDVLVQLLAPLAGVETVVWLLCLLTPVLTVIAIFAIARVSNRRGAYALPWALLFVFNFPFLWGFLNFSLTMALALIAFAAWTALSERRGWRAMLFVATTPLLLIGHGVAGIVLIALVVGDTVGERALYRPGAWRGLLPLWPLLAPALATIVVWKAVGAADHGPTQWLLYRKGQAVLMMLRDQDVVLDVGSVAACIAVWVLGWRWKARLGPGAAGAVLTVIAILIATPSLIDGSDRIDTRLAPLIPMLAFALQDWSDVTPHRRRAVTIAGFALLALRFGVTTASFVHYDQRYRQELAALDHIRPGARVLNLTELDCGVSGWRAHRLEHLANLATLRRHAWVNAHWSIDGLQLLAVRYRPSTDYYSDPSQLIWQPHCIDTAQAFADRDRHTLLEAMQRLPLAKVDYVWLISARLPTAYRNPRLKRVWSDDISELYETVPAVASTRR